jgi:hypothetical protein
MKSQTGSSWRLVPCILAIAVLFSWFCALAGRSGKLEITRANAEETQAPPSTNTNRFEFTGKIIKAESFVSENMFTTLRFKVEAEIIEVPTNYPKGPELVGSKAVFLIHSVAQTSREDTNSVLGKTYRIAYKDSFRPFYTGGVEVRRIASNTNSPAK